MTTRKRLDSDHPPSLAERLVVRSLKGTRRRPEEGGGHIVVATVANPWSVSTINQASYWYDVPTQIGISSTDGLTTVTPATVHRLMPGEEMVVEIAVDGSTSSRATSIHFETENEAWEQEAVLEGVLDASTPWKPSLESICEHSAPAWYRNAKFGVSLALATYASQLKSGLRSSYIGVHTRYQLGMNHLSTQNGIGIGCRLRAKRARVSLECGHCQRQLTACSLPTSFGDLWACRV